MSFPDCKLRLPLCALAALAGAALLSVGPAVVNMTVWPYLKAAPQGQEDGLRLAHFLLAAIYSAAQTNGLLALQLLVILTIVAILFLPALGRGVPPIILAAATAPLILVCGHDLAVVGPHSLSCLLCVAGLSALAAKPTGALAFVPLIAWAWFNLEDTALLGLAALVLYCVCLWGQAARFRRPISTGSEGESTAGPSGQADMLAKMLWTTLATVLALLVCLLPNTGAIQAACNEVLRPPALPEWHPLHPASNLGLAYLLLTAVALWAWWRGQSTDKKASSAAVVAMIALWLAPYYALRYLPFAALALTFVACRQLPASRQSYLPDRLGKAVRAPTVIYAALGLSVFAIACLHWFTGSTVDETLAPAVSYIRTHHLHSVVIGGPPEWGDYVSANDNQAGVSMDSRWAHAYNRQQIDRYLSFHWGVFPWDAAIQQPNTDCVLADKNTANFNLMKLTAGWNLVWEDKVAGLFVKSGI